LTFQTTGGIRAAAEVPALDAAPFAAIGAAANVASGRISFAGLCRDQAMVRAWERLERAACLPVQSYTFASALSSTLLAEDPIDVYYITGAGGAAALLPLCREPGPLGRSRMIGPREVFEPGDALCRSPEAARHLARALARESRPLLFERIPADSWLIPALRAELRGKGLVSVRPAVPTPTIALDPGWKDPDSRFNSGRRSDFRRAARRAADLGEVSFEMLSPRPEEFDALFDQAIQVEVCSWKKEAGTAIAVDRQKESFFRHFFRSACEQGTFRLAFMRIDGRVVAMQMALECLDRYWLFKIGFDERFARCSPGTLLMLHTLSWAAKRGLHHYELLGHVEPWIAQFWTRDRHDCVHLRTYPFNMKGAAVLAADAAVWLRNAAARWAS
jgi:CelD/BcsL family acetyltransferase involved in cellulose biosynthesis